MFSRLFIANRGEIAVRIIRACRELGIRACLPFHPVDRGGLWVKLADEAYPVLDRGPRDLFLDADFLVSMARERGADALHPGYGFLAENPSLSARCTAAGIAFVGPPAAVMQALGDKERARRVMAAAGVPVVPGTGAPCAGLDDARREADQLGFPVLLKAARGGGGRGMRRVERAEDLPDAFDAARREAQAAFGSRRIYLERYLRRPRHVEIQLMGDSHGNIVSLGERECSIQRRYQKLVEEAPSPIMTESLRRSMGEAAVRGGIAVGYQGMGTMEFLVDEKRNFYFLELNARIQVEHPVTELVTGLDLVREQILAAAGEPISFTQDDVTLTGHAIECRINCEDPSMNFAPSPGLLTAVEWPGGPGVRVESGVVAGYTVPSDYDSLVAKILAWGRTREEARRRLLRALAECRLDGIASTIPFHQELLRHPEFVAGNLSTHFLEECALPGAPGEPEPDSIRVAALLAALAASPARSSNGNGAARQGLTNWQRAARIEATRSLARHGGIRR